MSEVLEHLDLRTGRFHPLPLLIIAPAAPQAPYRERFSPLTISGHRPFRTAGSRLQCRRPRALRRNHEAAGIHRGTGRGGGDAVLAIAQQGERVPLIGYLGVTTQPDGNEWTNAFVHGLRELGWIEGRNVAVEFRWAEGRGERYSEITTEFVRLKVNVIVTAGGAVLAAKQATSVIPIVFAVANDPVGSGMVASLARPGGNVTGLSLQSTDIAGKRLEILREIVPGLRRLGVLCHEHRRSKRWCATVREMKEGPSRSAIRC